MSPRMVGRAEAEARLAAMQAALPLDGLHQPVVGYLGNETWGAYCHACSVKAGDYVYPCQEPTHCQLGNYWPPAKLYEREPEES